MASFNDMAAVQKPLNRRSEIFQSLVSLKDWEDFSVVVQGQDAQSKAMNKKGPDTPQRHVSIAEAMWGRVAGMPEESAVATAQIQIPDEDGLVQAFFVRYLTDKIAQIDYELEAFGFELPENKGSHLEGDEVLANYVVGFDLGKVGGDHTAKVLGYKDAEGKFRMVSRETTSSNTCPDCRGDGLQRYSSLPGVPKIAMEGRPCRTCGGEGTV